MNLILFTLIYLIQILFALKNYQTNCKNKTLYKNSIFLFHHLFDVYVFFGLTFLTSVTEKRIYLITLILLILHWFTNNYQCFLTVHLNQLCQIPEESWLDSLVTEIYKKTNLYYLHTFWILLAFMIVSFEVPPPLT